MQLTFLINKTPIVTMDISLANNTAKAIYVKSPLDANNILLPNERNYHGLEARLQFFLNTNKSLKLIIDELLQKYSMNKLINLHVDFQQNLNLIIEDKILIDKARIPKMIDDLINRAGMNCPSEPTPLDIVNNSK